MIKKIYLKFVPCSYLNSSQSNRRKDHLLGGARIINLAFKLSWLPLHSVLDYNPSFLFFSLGKFDVDHTTAEESVARNTQKPQYFKSPHF